MINKLIALTITLLLAVSIQAAVTNVYEITTDPATISFQPTPYDLAQNPATTKIITKGGMHPVTPGEDGFNLFFDSLAIGNFGTNTTGPYNLDVGLFSDGVSNGTTFICIFDEPKKIQEIHLYPVWGDDRQFNYTEVYASTTGTNEADYSLIGIMKNGEFGETNDPPSVTYYRPERLYDPDDGVLANNVTSLKFVQKNVGYSIENGKGVMLPPDTPQGTNFINCTGSAIKEIDVIGVNASVENEYYAKLDVTSLPFQPISNDLAQRSGATNYIVAGGMHTWIGLVSNFFECLFNSPSNGDLGFGTPLSVNGTQVILYDAPAPETLSLEMNCDFDEPKIIQEVRVFSCAGDARLFTYGEVYASTTGTNISDYTYIGAVSMGNWGDLATTYANSNCVARLYDSADGKLATGVKSLKIRFLGVCTNDYIVKTENANLGSAIGEVDILGISATESFITNTYEVADDPATLSIQPVPDDLWQWSGTTNYIVQGAAHGVVPDGTLSLYDSTAYGDFGPDAHGFANGNFLFTDGISPTNDTAIIVAFDGPKMIEEIHVFAWWGDQRQFNYTEVYGSTTGTNEADYSLIGIMKNGEFGETNEPTNVAHYRAARLYDFADGILATNITSIKLVQKNVGYGIAAGQGVMLPMGTPQGSYTAITGSAIKEIDIIGVPEPTLILSILLLSLAFLRRR